MYMFLVAAIIMFGNISDFFILPDSLPIILMIVSMLVWASYTDIKVNKVYQKMCLGYAILRVAVFPLYPISMNTVLGGVVGFLLLFLPAFLLNTSHMAGDIKFSAVLGLWMGGVPMLFGLLIGTIIFILAILIRRKGLLGIMPFAPFISIGCFIMIMIPYLAGWR